MTPFIVKYDFYKDGVDYLDQTMVVMAENSVQAEELVKAYFKNCSVKRYITRIYKLKNNMFVLMDKQIGNSVRVFCPEFCEENGIDFEMPKGEKIMEYNAFLVSFVEVINPLYKKERKAVVMAEDHGKAIEYVKNLVNADVKDTNGKIKFTGFVSTSMQGQEILLDNGTFATKNTIFCEDNIIDRNEVIN